MKKLLSILFIASATTALAAEPVNEKCPITGKDVNPKITADYEGNTYAFCSKKSRTTWEAQRKESLYDQIGGAAAISAAVDKFYVKVLADDSVNFFFEDINMNRQHNKQKAFIGAALGGPTPWDGKDMRTAHQNLDGLNDDHFNAIAGHLQATLEELKVDKDLIAQVMAVVGSTRDDVLGKKKKKKKSE